MSLQKGLVGHWPLDRESLQSATTFADKTPNENVGTKYGSVLKFDGGDDYVRIPDSASLSPINAMTAMCWVKGVGQNNKGILGHYDDNGQGSFLLFSDDATYSRVSVFISDNGSWDVVHRKYYISSIAAFDNAYHLVGFTFDAGTLKLFIDGVEDTNPTKTHDDAITTIHDSTADIMLGCYLNNNIPMDFFNGSIGDTRIYSRALTAAEVLTMYQGGVVSDTNLEAHWKFGDKSGAVLLDETANNNDGTLTNFADTTAEYGNTHDSGWNTDDTPNVSALDRMGQTGRAMSFDGTSDYIDCGNDESLDITTEDFTFALWINPNSYHNGSLFGKGSGNDTTQNYNLRVEDNQNIIFRAQGITSDDNWIDVLSSLSWQHILLTRNGTTLELFVDGISQGTQTLSADLTANNDNLEIGVWAGGSHFFFNGSIADVRIYNRVLSQQETTSLYEEYRPKLSMGSLMKGLVLDMPLNTKRYNAGNSKFDDLTPYENRGTNTGGDVDTDHTTFIAANSDNVRIPDSESLSPINAMTAMCWVKGVGQALKGILTHWDSNNQKSVFLTQSADAPNNKLEIVISDNGTTNSGHKIDYYSSIVTFDNTWHLVGFTFDAGTLKLYIDGVEDANPTKRFDDAITAIHNSTADIMLGCQLNSDTPVSFFNGDISGAKIWNRTLSAEEWLLAYDQTKGLYL